MVNLVVLVEIEVAVLVVVKVVMVAVVVLAVKEVFGAVKVVIEVSSKSNSGCCSTRSRGSKSSNSTANIKSTN